MPGRPGGNRTKSIYVMYRPAHPALTNRAFTKANSRAYRTYYDKRKAVERYRREKKNPLRDVADFNACLPKTIPSED